MQAVENRSLVEGEVVEVHVDGDRHRFRLKVSDVRPVEGYRDLLQTASGHQVEVIAPWDETRHERLDQGDLIKAELSLSRPGRTVLHSLADSES